MIHIHYTTLRSIGRIVVSPFPTSFPVFDQDTDAIDAFPTTHPVIQYGCIRYAPIDVSFH